MPKPKKALRSFRCSDVFWAAIEAAAQKQGISCNEFINLAVARALKDPIVGEAVDLENIAELANAIMRACRVHQNSSGLCIHERTFEVVTSGMEL